MRPHALSRLAAALLLAASTFACSDQPMSPAVAPNAKIVVLDTTEYDTYQVVRFTVDQDGGWFNIGPHYVYFPANAICDPAKSTYGPTEWDKPCVLITRPIMIRAEVQKN